MITPDEIAQTILLELLRQEEERKSPSLYVGADVGERDLSGITIDGRVDLVGLARQIMAHHMGFTTGQAGL